jgi:iron(III) transport system substrate-binding protein
MEIRRVAEEVLSIAGRRALLVALAAALLTVAGCAPAAPSPTTAPSKPAEKPAEKAVEKPVAKPAARPTTPAELAVYQGGDRQQILEEGARREGKVAWYTSIAGAALEGLRNGFSAKYPFIQLEVFRAGTNDVVTKAAQEAQAGQQVFDVLMITPSGSRVLLEAGVLARYHSPALAQVAETYRFGPRDGTVESAAVLISFVGFGYNSTLIPDSAAPRTVQDLLNHALTGKLALAGSASGYRWMGAVLRSMGDEKGRQFLTELANKQKPTVHQISGSALLDLIAKGEVPGSPNIFRDNALAAEEQKGAPVKWLAHDPVIANIADGSFAAKAPHPHAGLLFLDYLLTDGQKVMQDNFYTTTTETVPWKAWVPEEGRTVAQMDQDAKLWESVFKSIFR